MSTLKVDTINTTDGSGNITFSRPTVLQAGDIITADILDANVTTAKVADNAITLAKMAGGVDGNIISYDASGDPVAVVTGSSGQVLTSAGAGAPPTFAAAAASGINNDYLNKIIDPFFTIWPEGTSVTGVNSNEYGPCLWMGDRQGSSPVVVTLSQSTDVPTISEAGFKIPYAMKCLVTTADTAIAAGDAFYLEYRMPGDTMAQIHQQAFMVSFWCKVKGGTSALSGGEKICVSVTNSAENRSYVEDVAITANNTWQKIEVAVPADTSGTWLFTQDDIGMRVRVSASAGSNFQGTDQTWEGAQDIGTSSTANLMNEVNDEIHITAVQVEIGDTANDCFSPGASIIANQTDWFCQYYTYSENGGTDPIGPGYVINGTISLAMFLCRNYLRASPTLTQSAAATTGSYSGSASAVNSSYNIGSLDRWGFRNQMTHASGMTTNAGQLWRTDGNDIATVFLDARL